ncbi:chemotaxis protein CheB [Sorangium sp. So ce327]|uniref:chemotaxis protein CheB n=1 Tax=Sorangium sp. So ce327 TaxID=3133301 RepID=UPI003F6306E4
MSTEREVRDATKTRTRTVRPEVAPYVVGIGASAGGLEALEHFFANIPKESGMAFVVVQHLSPDFKSLMDEILGRRTELPIHLVENGMLVEPDHVYLIPPKKEMIISGGLLLLSERDRDQELALPIDVFFRSLAQDCGPRAIAVVLSGGGSDGSRGIRAVHDAGGLVVVQDVESAQFDGMPKTARDAGVADCVLPPQDMPRVLLDHVRSKGRRPERDAASVDQGMSAVYRMLEEQFGIDFTHYKPSTVTRRIERRIQLAHTDDIEQYVKRLRSKSSELDVLYRDLLIGVTRFFRNEEAFGILERSVLPDLLRAGPRDAPFRVWVAGCATGEEVYSLAILLHELTSRIGHRPFKVFATDVHHGSLEVATRGLYEEEAVMNVSPERLERHFIRRGRSYQVVPDLRQAVVFAHHNVIKDAPFTRVDFISCRNMLIYLQPPVQQKVLSLFHFALNRGGVVFLGPSETPGQLAHDFEIVDKQWRIYRKYSDRRMQVEPRFQPVSPKARSAPRSGITAPVTRHPPSHLLGTYDALLDEFMPPSLLVTDTGELVHAFGGASRFLKVKDGRQGLDAFEMLDCDLKMVLTGGLRRVIKERTAIVFKGVQAEGGTYKITMRRVESRRGTLPHVLITFEAIDGAPRRAAMPEIEIDLDDVSREQLGALEAELGHTKQTLQAMTEQLEASNEELQAANEELLASNEELQSTNEELQSVNEELYSVNAEYQRKIADLTELGNDMENLLSSTDIGTIFLDRELKIRKFTPQIAESFNLLLQDVGRPIETFTYAVDHPELTADLKRVLATGERVERELRDRHGRSFFLRILPYRAKGTIAGVVLTLIDVSGLKAAEDALFHERYLLNSLLRSVPDAIYFKDARGRFIRTNHAMAERLGLSDPGEAAGKTGFELPGYEAALAVHQEDEVVLRTGEAQHYKLEQRVRQDGFVEWDLVTRLPLIDAARHIVGIIGIFRSVTAQKRSEEQIKDAVRRRDEFLAMLSHELRNPLGAIVHATALLKEDCSAPDGASGLDEKVVQILERQSAQMARLLDDLLEASRVTQNKIELRKRVLDLGTVVKDAADAVKNLMDTRGVDFSVVVDPEPIWVEGDPARLQQVHVNLLNNAAKYTSRGGHVTLEAKRLDGHAVVRVKDDGVGIPKDMLDTVFELFVQSSRTLDRSAGGLGVGLTLVRGLVEKHGGTVSARSDGEGKGCEFEVRLPISEPSSEDEATRGSLLANSPRRSRVVVVEDNDDGREALCALLARAGFECHSASHGISGIELMDEVLPHVAIVDIGLPGIDGLEFARRVREKPQHKDVYLIALTGYGQQGDRERARAAGFDEHLVKPVDLGTLKRLLAEGEPATGESGAGSARPTGRS